MSEVLRHLGARAAGIFVVFLVACLPLSSNAGTIVRVSTTIGDFSIELLDDIAPITVQNFLNYVNRNDYNGTYFHRVVDNFVAQGGAYRFQEFVGPIDVATDPPIVNEFSVSNTRGTVAMAKLEGDPNSATNQWYVNIADNTNLDTLNGGFTVFGNVLGDGMDLVDEIDNLPFINLGVKASEAPWVSMAYSSPLDFLYMNVGINCNPEALWQNSQMSSYFDAVWGSRLKVDLTETTVARIGAYQVTDISPHGLNWNFYPNDGVMLLAQYGWNPEFGKSLGGGSNAGSSHDNAPESASKKNTASKKPRKNGADSLSSKGFIGHYWMGGYYSSWEYDQFNSDNKAPTSYGFYWHGDQVVYRPNPLTEAGLILWSDYVLCPQENSSLIPFQVNAGAIYTGLIPGRLNDFTLLGVMYGTFSKSYAGVQQEEGEGYPTYELVYEFGYRINMTKFAYIQPDLQWIINPGGTGNTPNALVLGAQMGIVF